LAAAATAAAAKGGWAERLVVPAAVLVGVWVVGSMEAAREAAGRVVTKGAVETGAAAREAAERAAMKEEAAK